MTAEGKYILALDVGDRRIGVALASPIARLASPLMVIDRQKESDVFGVIKELVGREHVGVLVVGWPRNMRGEETGQTARAREFAAELQKHTDAQVVLQDEAGTSVEAEQLLKQRGKPYAPGDIDMEAACLILRDYLQTIPERTA